MKTLREDFEDDLAALIDQYLMRDVDIEDLKGVLRDEAENDLEQVRSSLRSWARRALSPHQSAPANHGSLPSGESDPSVTLDLAGADTENPPKAWLEAKAEIDAGWPDKTA